LWDEVVTSTSAYIYNNKARCIGHVGPFDSQDYACATAVADSGLDNIREIYTDVTVIPRVGGAPTDYQPLFGLTLNVAGPGTGFVWMRTQLGGGIVFEFILDGGTTWYWFLTLYDLDGTTVLAQVPGYGDIGFGEGLPMRVGISCDAVGTVVGFIEPYGGGTRTPLATIDAGTTLAELHHGFCNASYTAGCLGGLDFDNFTVVTGAPLVAPTVSISGLTDVDERSAVYTGSAVLGSGTSIVSWVWTQVSGITVTLPEANEQISTVLFPSLVDGSTFTLRLTVTDDLGLTGYADITVTMTCIVFSETVPGATVYTDTSYASSAYTCSSAPVAACTDVAEPIAACDI
jgi:hypothetical protein